MKKIYLLTTGAYSDYRIIGAYSSKPIARKAMKAEGFDPEKEGKSHAGASIEEWDIDDLPKRPKGLWRWCVWMRRNGDVTLAELTSCWDSKKSVEFRVQSDKSAAHCEVWARDQDHAIKIVGDRRRQMIASGEWPEVDSE